MSDLVSTARRRELGAELRRIREKCGYNGQDMADRMGWLPSMVSRVETGKRTVTQVEVAIYTSLCNVTGDKVTELLDLAIEPDARRIKSHDGQIPDKLRTLIFHEQTANNIEVYEPIFIPGLTQTEDYIRALLKETGSLDPAGVENRVQIRLDRRSVLTRIYPALCTFYVHENALRTPVGGPQVMHEQMLHLLFQGDRPQCSIRVVPTSAGGRGLTAGSFHIFGYPEGQPVVYVQHVTTSEFLESREDLMGYRDVLKRIARVALDEGQSREFIARVASDYERQGVAQHDDHTERWARLA
jgi:transcriptional regulator with XRE-family HTH domain